MLSKGRVYDLQIPKIHESPENQTVYQKKCIPIFRWTNVCKYVILLADGIRKEAVPQLTLFFMNIQDRIDCKRYRK